jgi:hypothetical protein
MVSTFWRSCAAILIAATPFLAACSGRSALPASFGASAAQAPVLAPMAQTIGGGSGTGLPASSIPKHVLSWDTLGKGYFTTTVSDAQASQWLSWVMTSASDSAGFHSAGVKTMYYTQPNRQGPGGPEYSTDETTFAHDCNGERIALRNYAGHYLMQPASDHLGRLWQHEVETVTTSWHGEFDAIFEDLTDTTIYAATSPCDFNQTNWSGASNELSEFVTSVGLPVVYNGLSAFSDAGGHPGISATIAMNASAQGGMLEGCYAVGGNLSKAHDDGWIATENTEIAMRAAGKTFFCRALDETFARNAVPLRTYVYASFLLTYNRSTSVLAESFSTPDNFHELPEEELVATDASERVPSDVSGLLQPGGAYGRAFSACYIAAVSVGPCAVAVNPSSDSSAAFPWPTQYRHTLELSGQDIYGGGTIATSGAAPPATMGPMSAVIAFR